MKELSSRQQKILEFIRRFIRQKDYPPSIRDIQLGCAISSTSVVDYNLKALERLGYIRRDREVSRAIELLEHGARRPRTRPVPVVGLIAALVNDGDLVLMEQADSAEDGEMVAVWLNEEQETTLKRIYHEGDQIRL